jgi:hypothetical protein
MPPVEEAKDASEKNVMASAAASGCVPRAAKAAQNNSSASSMVQGPLAHQSQEAGFVLSLFSTLGAEAPAAFHQQQLQQQQQAMMMGAPVGGAACLFDLEDFTDESESDSEDLQPCIDKSKLAAKESIGSGLSSEETPCASSTTLEEPGAEPASEPTPCPSSSESADEFDMDVVPSTKKKSMRYCSASESEPEGLAATLMQNYQSSSLTESEPEDMEKILAAEKSFAIANLRRTLVSYQASDSESDCFDEQLLKKLAAYSETEPEAESTSNYETTLAKKTTAGVAATVPSVGVSELIRWRHESANTLQRGSKLVADNVAAEEMPGGAEQPATVVSHAAGGAVLPATVAAASSGAASSGSRPWKRSTEGIKGSASHQRPRASTSSTSTTSGGERLAVSKESFVAQQRARRSAAAVAAAAAADGDQAASNVEFARTLKAILNKLSVEKFEQLSVKIMEINFAHTDHVQILIEEIFARATTQHHFVGMYTDLCEKLNEFFNANPVSEDPKCAFKRLLLNECQRTFERNLEPPATLKDATMDERVLQEALYKTRMLGNIRFVGALLARHMIASKVLVSIMEELLTEAIPETLEALATLLTVTGAVFDTKDWTYFERLEETFARLKEMSSDKSCNARVRCILKDLIELRARKWETRQVKRVEGPTTLQAVAEKAKVESPLCAAKGYRSKTMLR